MTGQSMLIEDFTEFIPEDLEIARGSEEEEILSQRIKEFYYGDKEATRDDILPAVDLCSDFLFIFPAYRATIEHIKNSSEPVYIYYFTADTKLNTMKQSLVEFQQYPGAAHGDEIGYMLQTVSTPVIEEGSVEDLVMRSVIALWTNFAIYGNPTPDNSLGFKWESVDEDSFNYLHIGTYSNNAAVDPRPENMAFWSQIYEDYFPKARLEARPPYMDTLLINLIVGKQVIKAQEPLIEISQGILRGIILENRDGGSFYGFRRIPYAQPPLNELRFKAPVPADGWEDIRDAANEPPMCTQYSTESPDLIFGQEDCLYLNVFIPELPSLNSTKKPVMIYIHGGGFMTGDSTGTIAGPAFLMTKEVILVTIQYRLGVFGFINFEDPELGVPGNAGLKDQVLALKWIKENIEDFGGDSDNILIFGTSAGSISVHLHMLSPMSAGLFNKVIGQSGVALAPFFYGGGGSNTGVAFAEHLGIQTDNLTETLNSLRELSASALSIAEQSIPSNSLYFRGPNIELSSNEEAFLTHRPIDIVLSGNYTHVPYLTGINNMEGLLYESATLGATGQSILIEDFTAFIPEDLEIAPNGLNNDFNNVKILEQEMQIHNTNEQPSTSKAIVVSDLLTSDSEQGTMENSGAHLSATSSTVNCPVVVPSVLYPDIQHVVSYVKSQEPLIEISQGILRGLVFENRDGGIFYGFKGIPYAKPPINELRFRAPILADGWEGIRNATEEIAECAQFSVGSEILTSGAEDCLYLNVFIPEMPNENVTIKPVMVFIHGGAFFSGSASSMRTGPEFIMTKDVVFVSIQYRLGVFGLYTIIGFSNFEDPELEVPGNAGMKDQVLALKWVKENIAAFGGDPNNVLIFGTSAGLFNKVIGQSGVGIAPTILDSKNNGLAIAEQLGIQTGNLTETLRMLREVSAADLSIAEASIPSNKAIYSSPVVESPSKEESFLPERPIDILLSGNYNHVPFLSGFNDQEGLLYEITSIQMMGQSMLIEDFTEFIPEDLEIVRGSEEEELLSQRIKEFYYGDKEPSRDDILPAVDLYSDFLFIFPTYRAVIEHIKSSSDPVYIYYFTADTKLNMVKQLLEELQQYPGAAHGDELGYLFQTVSTPVIEEGSVEDLVMRSVIDLWTNFAIYGNPTPDNSLGFKWESLEENLFNYLHIGTYSNNAAVDPRPENMAFWSQIYEDYFPKARLEARPPYIDTLLINPIVGKQ
ncbi:carboxylesterase [Holotrichia oblita]|uniref:Carboxylesterase n=1 Tax=Holotrichia oblita TaxID=644536 RepID=A0ACB9T7T4_HOLOL|nr:carboxylesterase [Holotrichia oblita]